MAIEIHSPFPQQECLRRIEGTFDAHLGRMILVSPAGRVLGWIDGDTFKVVYMGWANTVPLSFWTRRAGPKLIFTGCVLEEGTGSRVVGDWDRKPTNVIYGLWLGFVGLALVMVSVVALATSLRDPRLFVGPPALGLMLLMGWLSYRNAREVQGVECRALVEILAATTGGQIPESRGQW